MSILTPIATVECDECGRTDDYELLCLAGHDTWSTRNVQNKAERDGWVFRGDRAFCEDCANGEGE